MSAAKAERIVNKSLLVSLVRESVSAKERTSSIAGTLGEHVAAAVENGNLHRKTYSLVAGIARMKNPAEREQVIRLFPLYIDMLTEAGFFPAQHVGDLADMAGQGDEEEGGEDGGSDGGDDAAGEGEVDPRDPVAAHAEDEWNKADPAAKDPDGDKPNGRRGKGMGDAAGSYKLQ
jgi:hypothetical protein